MRPGDEMLQMSGLQHFAFCRRQWALIHLEGLWAENLLTVEGQLLHARAHDEKQRERRGDTLILRSLAVRSERLGLSGKCDVVEFHQAADGVPLSGEEGLWTVCPVEYKRGKPKEHRADELQLCAQAMALEEMLSCDIHEGALFYGETRRREPVAFDAELRDMAMRFSAEMHDMMRRGHTPCVKPGKQCGGCSLVEICLPELRRRPDVAEYIRCHVAEEDGS